MIYISKESCVPLYEQVYTRIQAEIIEGSLAAGTRLPGIRTLSKTLGVARNTVDRAYAQLAVEGYITPRRGAGFIVEGAGYAPDHRISQPPALQSMDHDPDTRAAGCLYDFQYGNFPAVCFLPRPRGKGSCRRYWPFLIPPV